MPAQPVNWNVVVRASWNLAILTPRGIAERLFGLPSGTPVEVRVPLDARAPYQVHHEEMTVVATEGQLAIAPDAGTYGALRKAMDLASAAIRQLPETPYTAAGFNVRYRMEPAPPELQGLLRCNLDDRLSDAGHVIASRKQTAAWAHGAGIVNLEVVTDDDSGQVSLNFHLGTSDSDELLEWLKMPEDDISNAVESALTALGLLEVVGNA